MHRTTPRWMGAAMTVVALTACLMVSGAAPSEATAIGPATSAAPPGGPSGTGFVLPVAGSAVILNPFRPPATRYGPGHRGVDLALASGRPVLAAAGGVVVFAAVLAGRGVVSIDHAPGIRTTYEPVVSLLQAGDRVTAGQEIGTLAAGHGSCQPATCLHWGARLPDGSYVDPMGLLTGLQVRLLPWAR